MHLYLYSVANVLASKNCYYGFNKVGLPHSQQSMFYLYIYTLSCCSHEGYTVHNDMCLCRSGCNTRFPLYSMPL